MSLTLAEIAEYIDAELLGEPSYQIDSVGTLANAEANQLSFLSNPRYKKYLVDTKAGAVILEKTIALDFQGQALVVDDAYVAYAKAASLLYPIAGMTTAEIHSSAVIDESVQLGESVRIGANVTIEKNTVIGDRVCIAPGCVVEHDVKIDDDTILRPNVTICFASTIGKRGLLHPGVVIGGDGFGIANDAGKWIKVPQIGAVVIGDDVEIGANTTIDRGAIEDTIIADGVKLDNQIQIGHNVQIGEHTVMAGCAAIAGSSKVGKYCAIGGGTAISGHIELTDGVVLHAMSQVGKTITEPGVFSSVVPIEPAKQRHKNNFRYQKLDELFQRVKKLEKATENN